MEQELLKILACPICKGILKLSNSKEVMGDIISGTLDCVQCNEQYLIKNSIPNLLPPNLQG